MREPQTVTIVFGFLPSEQISELLRNSSLWLLETNENKEQVDAAAEINDLVSLPGQISFTRRQPTQGTADWLLDTLGEIDSHHDGFLWTKWEQIDVIGLDCTPAIEEVAQSYGDVVTSENQFTITSAENDG